jgi:hypothetical protein
VSIDQFPYVTVLGNPSDTRNPKTGKLEAFPAVTAGLDKHNPDDAHQPSIAYLPYVISGDYYYLEELQFWADYNMVISNPEYRGFDKGLLNWGQVRAQAWSMRTLGQAAYITPDAHPLKNYFNEKLRNNIAWYAKDLVGIPNENPLGYLNFHYVYEPYGLAPWMDNFFTWTMGFLDQLGYHEVKPLLLYKSKFVVGLLTDPGYCWLHASAYSLQVGTAKRVPYRTFGEVYKANYPNERACVGYEMEGYPSEATGFGANMQPALAAAVDAGAPGAREAWEKYQTRSPKQDFSVMPEFDVVPRGFSSAHAGGTGGSEKSAGTDKPGKPRGPGTSEQIVPGNPIVYKVAYPSDVFLEVFDGAGNRLVSVPLGRVEKGSHSLDWEKDVRANVPKGDSPVILKIKGVDPFKHPDYVKIVGWDRRTSP